MKINRNGSTDNLPIKAPHVTSTQRVAKHRNKKKQAKSCELVKQLDKTTGKVDLAVALEMRFRKGRTFEEIAEYFHVSPQAVHQRLRAFMGIIQSPEALKAYQNSKQDILSAVEFKLMSSLLDANKLKDASLNNVAYALQNVFNMNRLEQDKSTSNIAHALRFEVIETQDADQPAVVVIEP